MTFLISNNELENAWLELGDTSLIEIEQNPFLERADDLIYEQNPGLFETDVLRRPEYLSYFCYVILGITLAPYQMVIIDQMWRHSFPMLIASRGSGKSWIMGVYSLLRCLLMPDHKVVATGPSFRQSKVILEYAETIWNNSPVLRSLCGRSSGLNKSLDHWRFFLEGSVIIGIPIGDGSKVRGLRANTVIADEFKDHDARIIEEVVMGFGAVAADPMEKLKEAARLKELKKMDVDLSSLDDGPNKVKNQSIICGTASYYFEIFYDYWRRYKAIIETKGNVERLKSMGIPFDSEHLSYKDFCVMRLPYSLLPDGYFSEKVIARAKTSMSEALYLKEYEAIFVEDSDGFFKRSLIESACATQKNINAGNIPYEFCDTPFDCGNFGDEHYQYVMGIDPAFKEDNFAISILECHPTHSRLKYIWITNEDDFIERKKHGVSIEDNYYAFCCRHIRELMKSFNIIGIAIDAQGGGMSLMETLASTSYLHPHEKPVYPIVEPGKRKDTDHMSGHHIIHIIQFANANWVSQSNHGLLADLEKKRLLLPRFDPVTVELSIASDKIRADNLAKQHGVTAKQVVLYDSLEDVANNIEDLKDELTSIQYSKTGQGGIGGREKWSVPEVRVDETTKVGGKKDRYCALLMANYLANEWRLNLDKDTGEYIGGSLVQGGIIKKDYDTGYSEQSGYAQTFDRFGLAKRNNNVF